MKTVAAVVLALSALALAACDNGAKPAPGATPTASGTAASTAPAGSASAKSGSGW